MPPKHRQAPAAPSAPPRQPTFSGFLLRLIAYLFLVSLPFSLGGLHLYLKPVQHGMAVTVAAGASLLGAIAQVDGTVITTNYAALDINHECTAVFVLVVYAMFVLAYPAAWLQRLSGIAIGTAVLMVVNVARLIALTVIASKYPTLFPYFHEYFFQGLFIALLAILASLWTEQVRRATVGRVSA